MSQPLSDEFRLTSLSLNYPLSGVFVSSQWRCKRWMYVLWRLLWCLWFIAVIIASAANFREHLASSSDGGVKWFIYYSHLTLVLTACTCILDLVGVLTSDTSQMGDEEGITKPPKSDSEKDEILFHGQFVVLEGLKEAPTPILQKVTWLFYNVINSSNILASAWFWAVQYDSHTYAVEIVAHVTNTLYVVSNLFVSAQPVRLLHAVYPVIYTALYAVFTLLYHVTDGTTETGRTRIYRELDWGSAYPTAVVVVVGLLVVLPLMHSIVFAIFTFRVYLHSKVNSASYSIGSRSEVEVTGVKYVNDEGHCGGIRNCAFEDDECDLSSNTYSSNKNVPQNSYLKEDRQPANS